ncbi:MAG: 4-hydroxybenzoate octaprenyltransferase, partial [Rhodobacteraceae bacterium]|nr:4-hydroxybenzoate octaprenyltransferase [Paracoccaceae bacterium]
ARPRTQLRHTRPTTMGERVSNEDIILDAAEHRLFLAAQALVGLAVLLQFNRFAILVGFGSLAVVAIYPFMKRIMDWPQFVLGLAFSWGALMGWAATFGQLGLPAYLLYAAAVLWTIGYDTIYAHQDREDDALVGVRSTARLFDKNTKPALVMLYSAMVALMAAAFAAAQVPLLAWIGLAAGAAHMARQIAVLDIDDGAQCLALFKSNSTVGWLIFAGLVAGSLSRLA